MYRRRVSIFLNIALICAYGQFACLAQNSDGQSNKSKSSQMLYGRIEQIAGSGPVSFPALKEQTAKLDVREVPKTVQKGRTSISSAGTYTGTVIRSFPPQFSGVWGGHLKIWSALMDPICWQLDRDEAIRIRQLMVPGREGSVNFRFQQSRGEIELEPAQVVFMVPMKDTHMQEELNSMLGSGQTGGLTLPGMDAKQMASAMQQMANTMSVPIIVSFGAVEGSGLEGVSGNDIRASVLRNVIRKLSPTVLEQQIVTQETQRNKKTGQIRQEYSETVIRLTGEGPNSLYVQAAAVNYTSDRRFERKLILYGMVHRGQVMQDASNPMGALGTMMNGGQMPQLPAGQNPFKGLLPQ